MRNAQLRAAAVGFAVMQGARRLGAAGEGPAGRTRCGCCRWGRTAAPPELRPGPRSSRCSGGRLPWRQPPRTGGAESACSLQLQCLPHCWRAQGGSLTTRSHRSAPALPSGCAGAGRTCIRPQWPAPEPTAAPSGWRCERWSSGPSLPPPLWERAGRQVRRACFRRWQTARVVARAERAPQQLPGQQPWQRVCHAWGGCRGRCE
mmetsp:Transcript_19917/g.60141  ORF Transcript_19917/g.60141 Transcript_19917/m.60141 type:complete len:204 (+) Transcript_19917:604-1215(+)